MSIDRDEAQKLWTPTCHGRWMSEECEPGLVSVIVPTYNRAHRLAETLDSIYAQTYRPIEAIVVDDGSTDDTAEVLAGWRSEHSGDPQFTLADFRQENKGAPAARNRGAIESHGEYIHFWDCEDIMHPEKIARQAEAAARHRADLVVCDIEFFWNEPGDSGENFDFAAQTGTATNNRGVVNACICAGGWNTQAVLFRRSVLCLAGPWRESLRRHQDVEFNVRAAICADSVVGVREPLSFERIHGEPGCISADTSQVAFQSMVDAYLTVRDHLRVTSHLNATARLFLFHRMISIAELATRAGHRDVVLTGCRMAMEFAPPRRRLVLKLFLKIIEKLKGRIFFLVARPAFAANTMANALRVKRTSKATDLDGRSETETESE